MDTHTANLMLDVLERFTSAEGLEHFTAEELAAAPACPLRGSPQSIGRRLLFAARSGNPSRVAAGRLVLGVASETRNKVKIWSFREDVGMLVLPSALPRLDRTVDEETRTRLSRLAVRMSRPGLRLTLEDATRMAIAEGLAVLDPKETP